MNKLQRTALDIIDGVKDPDTRRTMLEEMEEIHTASLRTGFAKRHPGPVRTLNDMLRRGAHPDTIPEATYKAEMRKQIRSDVATIREARRMRPGKTADLFVGEEVTA